MTKRSVNSKLLRNLVRTSDLGRSIEDVADALGVSKGLLDQLFNGTYKPQLKERTRYLIYSGLNVSETELFPLLEQGDGEVAS